MNKIKLLALTNILPKYRIPVYNLLSDSFDVTVAHYGALSNDINIRFNQIILTRRNIGPFIAIKQNVKNLAEHFDAVIALGDMHILPYIKLGFLRDRTFALTYWTIGVSASYKNKFDEKKRYDKLRFKIMNLADSIVFYTDYPIKRYVEDGGIERKKLFVAHNTIEINHKVKIPKNKNHFIFVGTLYKEKNISELLKAYLIANNINPSLKPLIIIGDGEEKKNIETWIQHNKLQNKVLLKGAIYDQADLIRYYQDAIACISPGQAGLTVLNSMAYGVPFVTNKTAITGGEIFNISHGINGIIYDGSIDLLSNILLELSQNNEKVFELSTNAKHYYFEHRTLATMVNGLRNSIYYALNHKI